MLNEQIMVDTVSRLLEAGIDEPTICQTLADAGLSNEEALAVIARVKSGSAAVPAEASSTPAPVEPQDIQLLKNQVAAVAEQHDLHQTTTINALENHEERLSEVAKSVEEVKASVASPAVGDPALSFRISQLEAKLEEVSAGTKALMDVLSKILEANRQILTNLEAQK